MTGAMIAARHCLQLSRHYAALAHWGAHDEHEEIAWQLLSRNWALAGLRFLANAETQEAAK